MLYFYFRFDIDINKNEEVSSQEDRVSGFRIGLMFDRFFGKPYVICDLSTVYLQSTDP